MIKRRDLLKAGGVTSALLGLGAFGRLLSSSSLSSAAPALASASHDFILEFKPDALLARSPQLQQTLQECMHFITMETNGKVLPVLAGDTSIQSDKPRIQVALSSPSLKSNNAATDLSFFSRLPQGLNHDDKRKWLTSEVGMRLWQEAYASLGLKPLYFGQGPKTEYQLLSRSPNEILNVHHSVFLTKNANSLRAQLSGRQVIGIHKYQKLMISHHMPFESDAIPAVTILQKGIAEEKNLKISPSNFLSTSVFEMNLRQTAWDHLPQDMQKLLVKVSLWSGDRLTSLLNEKETEALQKISLVVDDQWQFRDMKHSEKAYQLITQASSHNAEIAKIYETFRQSDASPLKKIS